MRWTDQVWLIEVYFLSLSKLEVFSLLFWNSTTNGNYISYFSTTWYVPSSTTDCIQYAAYCIHTIYYISYSLYDIGKNIPCISVLIWIHDGCLRYCSTSQWSKSLRSSKLNFKYSTRHARNSLLLISYGSENCENPAANDSLENKIFAQG